MNELKLIELIELICSEPSYMLFEEVCFILEAYHYGQKSKSEQNMIFRHKSTGELFNVPCTDDKKIKPHLLEYLKVQLKLEC